MEHPFRFTTLRAALFFFLVLSSSAILYTTYQNTQSAHDMADQALESTGLALASTLEAELRSGDSLSTNHVRRIFSDRVIAYALVADKRGLILFHTNPDLTGSRLQEPGLENWLQAGQAYSRRVILGTGLPAYTFNYPLHLPDGRAELLRLVLHSFTADQIVSKSRGMWWTVGLVLLILWTIGILFDRAVSRQIRLQQELQHKNQLAIIGQMTAVLAHEIRNALGSIKGYTQWIDEKINYSDPNKSGLTFILMGVQRIETLVEDLLLYSREEAYRMESLSVDRIIQEVLTSEMMPEEKRIVIDIEPGIKMTADQEKVHRVLLNGMRNAFQSMEEGQDLRVSAKSKGDWIEIRLEDTGEGISQEEISRLFTPFHTTKTTGTGLGLAYSKKVIEGMGGEIDLFNRDSGKGAVLVIKLPKAERT